MRGEPNSRPNAASSAAPRFWSRNTSTGCSANARLIQAKVTSSSGLERSMPNASVPSSSPSGRSWGELVMGGPPTLSPERHDGERVPLSGFGSPRKCHRPPCQGLTAMQNVMNRRASASPRTQLDQTGEGVQLALDVGAAGAEDDSGGAGRLESREAGAQGLG